VLLAVLAVISVPAVVLRALCAGNACPAEPAPSRVPFCGLPGELRAALAAGFREGRSPDVLAVPDRLTLFTRRGGLPLPWPGLGDRPDPRVPLAIWGSGVPAGVRLGGGITLDDVAPTAAALLGFHRPFPEVRSGQAIPLPPGPSAPPPRLVLLVAWKGIGTADLEARPDAWPFLAGLLRTGAGTLRAETGSLPVDPAAVLTTIGTGGLPSQHGITGALVRNDRGDVVEAFGPGSPVQVIATLADDLDHHDHRTLVGLVGQDAADRGLVGGGWYPDEDPVDEVLGDPAAAPLAVHALLGAGFGADPVPDVLGVALRGSVERLDRLTRRIVSTARSATHGAVLVVVAGTGTTRTAAPAVPAEVAVRAVEAAVPGGDPVVAGVAAGGLFLDQHVLTERGITGQAAVDALLHAETPDGERMFADAFQGFAVTFARYC
jgi:hypothetical protein